MSKPKTRGNGQGTAYRRGNSWTAEVVIGWRFPEDPSLPKRKVRRKKGGFPTKKAALEYCPQLMVKGNQRTRMTLQQVWSAWETDYAPRVLPSTMDGYRYAFKHFSILEGTFIDLISSDDLQRCMNDCPSGKRTHENMKCVAGLLWAYAVDKNIIDRDITRNLYTGKGKSVQRDPLTKEEEKTIYSAIGKYRYAEYIYCLCYLGFRPGEMLELRKDQLFCATIDDMDVWYFVNGKKTEAGKNRIVIIPNKIIDLIVERLFIPGTDLVFPMYKFNRKKEPELVCFKQMTDAYFREEVFKPMMKKLSIAEGKVPYGARHSYADKLKEAIGADRDKAALIGHSNYLFTQAHYQSTDLADLKAIVESFK